MDFKCLKRKMLQPPEESLCMTNLLPVFVLLLVLGIMQVTYTLECIRLSKKGGE